MFGNNAILNTKFKYTVMVGSFITGCADTLELAYSDMKAERDYYRNCGFKVTGSYKTEYRVHSYNNLSGEWKENPPLIIKLNRNK